MQHVVKADSPLILYIEDEPDLRDDVAEELEDAGMKVIQAGDGEQALQILQKIRPDLILCDITMPGMSGYDLLQRLRQTRADLVDIPFVFLTAQTDPKQIVDGKRAGADDYLIKPVDFDLMLATIQARITQIERIRQRHVIEVKGVQDALRELHTQRTRDTFEHITRAFDYVSFGIVLLGADAAVRFSNRAARSMANSVAGMCLDGVVRLEGTRQTQAFRTAFDAASRVSDPTEDFIECLSIARSGGQRDILLMVCALACHHEQDPNEPIVMVIMADPAHRQPIAASALESLFGLTPTEAQIANAFADGRRSEEIARQFSISLTTVNFHKRNLFEKTGTNRQADLIALLLSLPVSAGAYGVV